MNQSEQLAANYGDIKFHELESKGLTGEYTELNELNPKLKDDTVLVRGRVNTVRAVGRNTVYVMLRFQFATVECVLTVTPDLVCPEMLTFAIDLAPESIVDVQGIVSVPTKHIKTTQQVEIQVRKLYCITRPNPLPIVEDESEIEQLVQVNPDTPLNRPANQAIFNLQDEVEHIFRQFLRNKGFKSIHTPNLNLGASEGGPVFGLDKEPACLAQSLQHKQMAIFAGHHRVFEVGPKFCTGKSDRHGHLCEFTGLDVEMEILEHYSEVMDIVDRLFVVMFDYLNETCSEEFEAINKQYPVKKLKYGQKTLRLTYEEGVQMLKEDGVEIEPFGDLNTETRGRLCKLVLEKHGIEFYILHRYPLAVRPFYTMPCHDNPKYSNSFDVFLRGEEVISGSQRIHEPELLKERAQILGIDLKTIESYIDSFSGGTGARH